MKPGYPEASWGSQEYFFVLGVALWAFDMKREKPVTTKLNEFM